MLEVKIELDLAMSSEARAVRVARGAPLLFIDKFCHQRAQPSEHL